MTRTATAEDTMTNLPATPDRVLAACAAAGVEVHHHETDDHYVDLRLTPLAAADALILSWYDDRQGWRLVEYDADGGEVSRWMLGADLDAAIRATSAILRADDEPAGLDPAAVAAIRWALTHGWTYTYQLSHYTSPDGLTRVDVHTDGEIAVRHRDDRRSGWCGADRYPVRSARQAVDVLAAIGVLPAHLSGAYAAGETAALAGATTRYDRNGGRWWLQWISDQDTPGMTRADVEAEYGPLSTTPPPVDQQPTARECLTPVPGAEHLTCGTTAVGTVTAAGDPMPICQAHAEIARAAGMTVHPLGGPAEGGTW